MRHKSNQILYGYGNDNGDVVVTFSIDKTILNLFNADVDLNGRKCIVEWSENKKEWVLISFTL